MQAKLDRAAAPAGSPTPGALYLTSGGYTSGPGTLMDAMMRAAGFRNLTTAPGFGAVSVEQIALQPPIRFVLGFFDQLRADWRGAGRHPCCFCVSSAGLARWFWPRGLLGPGAEVRFEGLPSCPSRRAWAQLPFC